MKKIILNFLFVFLSLHILAQWQPCGPYPNLIVNEISRLNSELLIATKDSGVYISQNNINSWKNISSGLSQLSINSVISDSEGFLYAGTRTLTVNISSDTGKSWTPVNMGGTGTEIKCLFNQDNKVFAGQKNDGVFVSTNYGASWNEIALCCESVLCLCSDMSGTIYAGTSGGNIYYSAAPYTNWDFYGNGFPNSAVMDLILSDGVLYAASYDSGIFNCSHADSTWILKSNGLPDLHSTSVAVSGNKLFAAINGSGVFVSIDNGNSWVNSSEGLNNLNVVSLFVFDNYLYAGTIGGGLWKRAISEMNSIHNSVDENKFNIFPTLVREYLYIDSNELNSTIEIMDMTGKCVFSRLVSARYTAIDVGDFKNGMYLIRMINGNKISNQKFIKY